MATVNPVIGLESIAPLISIINLIEQTGLEKLKVNSPIELQKLLNLMAEQLKRITNALDSSDLNFQTLYNNDSNLNYVSGSGTVATGGTTVSLGVTQSSTSYAVVACWADLVSVDIPLCIHTKTTTYFIVQPTSAISSHAFDWIAKIV